MNIVVKKADIRDVETIQTIGRETFFEAFAHLNTEADMKKYLDDSFNLEQIGKEMNNPESSFFIACESEQPIAYLKLNTGKAQTELHDENALEIERIYVKAAYQGKQIGQLLYQTALSIAQTEQRPFIWLGVWEHNLKAINFYSKHGFAEFGRHIFMLGNDEQTDIMMKKPLE